MVKKPIKNEKMLMTKWELNVEHKGKVELWMVRSNTASDKWYAVYKPNYLGPQERIISTNMGCNCKGWRFRKHCSHIDLILQVHNKNITDEAEEFEIIEDD